MELEKKKQSKMFELRPVGNSTRIKGGVFGKGRILLGRSESCELMIRHDSISAIHAVMEIFDDKAIIYDMNSTNGTFVNDDKVIVKEMHVGDTFRLADLNFELLLYNPKASLPPVLDSLEPGEGSASVKLPPVLPETVSSKPLPHKAPKTSDQSMPSIVYPLAADPRAEFSEYIFEDRNQLYPIFKYEASRQAVEVIILFKDNIFSVDYLPEGKSTYFITGIYQSAKDLEFPYLGKKEKFPFVEVKPNHAVVTALPGFEIFHLSDKKKESGHVGSNIELSGQDLVRLQKDDLQIFVRHVAAPPKVASAPILKRDPDFQKYLAIMLFLVGAISIGLNLIEVPEDPKKDELAPERLATILYKQALTVSKNKSVEKSEVAVKKAQTAPDKVAVEKKTPTKKQPDVKKPDVVTTKTQNKRPDPGKKTAPTKKVVKRGVTPPKPSNKVAASKPAAARSKSAASAKAPTAMSQVSMKTAGHVEVYKSADFKSSISTLVAKGGSLAGVRTKSASGASGAFTGAASGVSTGSGQVQTADISTNQGSLVGAASGALGESKGAKALSAKRAIYTAGIPSETVVLGSMDPDVIRRILLDHLPQFRYCYQQELNRAGTETSGTVKLNFTIGASGHVSQAGVDGSSGLPTEVKKCVVGVLRGITFPEPMGGGTVEVKQPINFYPKKI